MKFARKLNWLDYFYEKVRVNQTKNGTAFSDTKGVHNYYVYLCTFEECKTKGAIYIRSFNPICTLLEDNTFTKCKSTSDGGSVYYDCPQSGQFVQQRNCYSESIANRSMAFSQRVCRSPNYKNYAFQISVSKCGEIESEGLFTFEIGWGDLRFENNNITYNKCISHSSIDITLNRQSSTCNFSTFRENNQTGSESLEFFSNSNSYIHTVSYCNIIGNKCGTNSNQVLFSCTYNTTVDHCVFLNNTAKYMFQVEKSGYNLTITDSYVEIKSTTSTGRGSVTFTKENSNFDLNEIPNFNTKICLIEPKQTFILPYISKFAETSSHVFQNSKR